MRKLPIIRSVLMGSACVFGLATAAHARSFDIPGGDLENALQAFTAQTGVNLIVADDQVRGIKSRGVSGDTMIMIGAMGSSRRAAPSGV